MGTYTISLALPKLSPLMIDRSLIRMCLRFIARGTIRFCLKHSVKVQELEETLRFLYLEEAAAELRKSAEKVSQSRLSVITGLSRKEVLRMETLEQEERGSSANLVMKVVGLWQSHSQFADRQKTPKVLSFGFEQSDFNKLVTMVSTDLNPATVLFELERVGSAVRTKDGVKLLVKSYRPRGDAQAGFKVLGDDIEDLISVVEENVFVQPTVGNLHLRTEYDRIREDGVTALKTWLIKEGNAFHARAREKIASFDQDVSPDPSYQGKFHRIILGSFGAVTENEP